jgi:hypothetical protein
VPRQIGQISHEPEREARVEERQVNVETRVELERAREDGGEDEGP